MKKMKEGSGMVGISLPVEATLWAKIVTLAEKNGVPAAFVVRRSLIQTVQSGHVYWPTDGEAEGREAQKFGTVATPTIDDDSIPIKHSVPGKKTPVIPVE